MTDSRTDPLAALIVDGEELDKDLIVKALQGIAGLNKSGEVVHLPGFSALSARQKVLVYLLAYKAADILGLRDQLGIGGADLARLIGLAEGTVYPTLSRLRRDRAVSQDTESKYFLAHHQVARATAEVASGLASASGRTASAGRFGTRPRRRKPSGSVSPEPTVVRSEERSTTTETAVDGSKSQRRKARPTPTRARTPRGFSPASAVAGMISDGFFNEPKGLGAVRTHLKDVHARDVPVTTLSPIFTRLLRSSELRRQRNASGKYEYFVPNDR
jgi:hypothetical protein